MNRENQQPPIPPGNHGGCHFNASTWIKVGLGREQAAHLKRLAKLNKVTSGRMAWTLLNAALAHVEIVTGLANQDRQGTFHGWPEGRYEAKARARRLNLN